MRNARSEGCVKTTHKAAAQTLTHTQASTHTHTDTQTHTQADTATHVAAATRIRAGNLYALRDAAKRSETHILHPSPPLPSSPLLFVSHSCSLCVLLLCRGQLGR